MIEKRELTSVSGARLADLRLRPSMAGHRDVILWDNGMGCLVMSRPLSKSLTGASEGGPLSAVQINQIGWAGEEAPKQLRIWCH